jgi:two-component sensor histidine kinase
MVADGKDSTNVTTFPLIEGQDSDSDALTSVIRRLASAQTLPEIMEIVTHAARVLLAADGISFVLKAGNQCYYAEEDAIASLWKGRRFPMSACISGWCMENGRAVAIPDIYEDDRIPHDAYRPTFVKSLAVVPVRHEEPVAALGAYWARCHQTSAAELDMLQTIANAAALPVAYVQLRDAQLDGSWRQILNGLWLKAPRLAAPVWHPSPQFVRSQRAKAVALGVALVAGAFFVRMPLNSVVGREVPYATFYGAVLLATMWGGWVAGLTTLILGGVTANIMLVEPIGRLSLSRPNVWALVVYILVAAMVLIVTHRLVMTRHRERELNKKLELVRGELQHRIKNSLAVVQALAVQTARSSSDTAEFDAKFTRRLQALAGAQSLIHESKQSAAGLALVIERALVPFDLAGSVKMTTASQVRIGEDAAVGLALILNELATNALKHGALSTPAGTVLIECDVRDSQARINWCEQGGPAVSPPSRKGFGTRLIHSALSQANGTVDVDYRQDGVRCVIGVPCIGS